MSTHFKCVDIFHICLTTILHNIVLLFLTVFFKIMSIDWKMCRYIFSHYSIALGTKLNYRIDLYYIRCITFHHSYTIVSTMNIFISWRIFILLERLYNICLKSDSKMFRLILFFVLSAFIFLIPMILLKFIRVQF